MNGKRVVKWKGSYWFLEREAIEARCLVRDVRDAEVSRQARAHGMWGKRPLSKRSGVIERHTWIMEREGQHPRARAYETKSVWLGLSTLDAAFKLNGLDPTRRGTPLSNQCHRKIAVVKNVDMAHVLTDATSCLSCPT